MLFAGLHEGQNETSPCACKVQDVLHGWEPTRSQPVAHASRQERQRRQQREVTALADAIDQISSLQKALAAKQTEIDVLTEALGYARGLIC
jgi:hypothetical protein